MRDNFSDIDQLYDVLEGLDDMEDKNECEQEGFENGKKVIKISYSLRQWEEVSFIEHIKAILTDTAHCNIQRIILQCGKEVYLVPEPFYSCRANEIYVKRIDDRAGEGK